MREPFLDRDQIETDGDDVLGRALHPNPDALGSGTDLRHCFGRGIFLHSRGHMPASGLPNVSNDD